VTHTCSESAEVKLHRDNHSGSCCVDYCHRLCRNYTLFHFSYI